MLRLLRLGALAVPASKPGPTSGQAVPSPRAPTELRDDYGMNNGCNDIITSFKAEMRNTGLFIGSPLKVPE